MFRTEGHAGCDFGKTKIAETTGLSFVDTQVANGRDYHYNVVAAGAANACFGAASNCVTVTPAAGPPPPDFTVACSPSSLTVPLGGAGGSTCTVTSLNGFTGAVTLSCSGAPDGVLCGFGPNPLTVNANGTARAGFTVAAGPSVPNRVHTFEVAAASGATRHTASVSVETVFVAPPRPVSSRSFMVSGCTGYTDGVPNTTSLQAFGANFAIARKKGLTGPGCVETLAAPNGRFDLEVRQGCFAEGESFDLLAGGLPTCASRPFTSGANDWAVLLGRRTACP